MKVLSITPRTYNECIDPTIRLDVAFSFPRGERLPLDVTSTVATEDGRVLGIARLAERESAQLPLDSVENGQPLTEVTELAHLALPISHKCLNHIERVRSANRKGDVILRCNVQVHFLVSNALNAHFDLTESTQKRDVFDVTYRHHVPYRPNRGHGNMWVLSGRGGQTFACREVSYEERTTTIVSSDWLHDFSGPWQTTSFVVFEVPRQHIVAGASGLQTWVNTAIEAVEAASEDLRRGDWNGVVAGLRPVWELFRNHPDIKALLEGDGYSPDAATALNDSVKHQFELASKFVHRTDKSGKKLAPEIRASREDAYLVYAFAAAVVNLMSTKLERANSK